MPTPKDQTLPPPRMSDLMDDPTQPRPEAEPPKENGHEEPTRRKFLVTASDFRKVIRVRVEALYLPGMDAWVWIKALTSHDLILMNREHERSTRKRRDGTFPSAWERDQNARMVVHVVCDENGDRVLTTEDMKMVSEDWLFSDTFLIIQKANELSGLNLQPQDREDELQDFEAAESAG